MTQGVSSVMAYTGDFTSLGVNNPHEWSQSFGGAGVKRRQEAEAVPNDGNDRYYMPNPVNETQAAVEQGEFKKSYGSTMLNNMTQLSAGEGGSHEAIRVHMPDALNTPNLSSLPTTPAVLPSDLTTHDRLSSGSPAYDVGSLANPNTLGETLGGLIEKVHDNALSYEAESDKMINKSRGSAFEQAKDSLLPDYTSLTGIDKTDNEQDKIERQIEQYIQVMNGSYEYYIYSSLFVDSGKSISQTAQNLTRG